MKEDKFGPDYSYDYLVKELRKLQSGPNYRNFVKALFTVITECDDKDKLEKAYSEYMCNDNISLFDERLNDILTEEDEEGDDE